MKVKLIEENELMKCHQIIVSSFMTVTESLGMTKVNCPGNSAFLELKHLKSMINKGLIIYGLYDTSLIGCIGLEKKSDSRYKIKLLSVLEAYRHKGSGFLLVSTMEEKVISFGGCKVQLGMIYENEVLTNWYGSLGYKIVKIKNYKDNCFKIAFMEKDLK